VKSLHLAFKTTGLSEFFEDPQCSEPACSFCRQVWSVVTITVGQWRN